MSTVSVRVNEEEMEEIRRVVMLASRNVRVSRHNVMKSAMMRGLREMALSMDCQQGDAVLTLVTEQ